MTYSHIKLLQTDADLADPREYDPEARPVSTLSTGEAARLAEADAVLTGSAFACRDWEGFLIVVADASECFDILSITGNGRIGYGGINMPRYFNTLAEVLDS
jgi:hypothetical protein